MADKSETPGRRPRLKNVLRNWRSLMANLSSLDEDDAWWCLVHERRNERRPAFIERIYGRYARLRQLREKQEMMLDLYDKK